MPILVLILTVSLALSVAGPAASAPPSVTVQLGMLVDGSGSIDAAEWTTILEGLAAAVEDPAFPKDGTVELTLVQFGDQTSQLEVGPVVVTSGNYASVAGDIRGISQLGGWTHESACPGAVSTCCPTGSGRCPDPIELAARSPCISVGSECQAEGPRAGSDRFSGPRAFRLIRPPR